MTNYLKIISSTLSLVIPERIEIYDRKGRVLAANRDAFSLYIKSSENLNIEKILKSFFSLKTK